MVSQDASQQELGQAGQSREGEKPVHAGSQGQQPRYSTPKPSEDHHHHHYGDGHRASEDKREAEIHEVSAKPASDRYSALEAQTPSRTSKMNDTNPPRYSQVVRS